jgi:hypothetical protein
MPNVNVDFVLEEVETALPLWRLIRDCLDGQQAVKKRGTLYVPQPNAADTSTENNLRYDAYLTRGNFMNFTSRTLSGMVGAVFGKDAVATLPDALMPLYNNVDGSALTLDQQAKKVLSDALSVGRCGLLTDYPVRNRPATRKEVAAGKVRPTIQFYFAEDIPNWRYSVVEGIRHLSLVVLRESYVVEDDGFKMKTDVQYRVLRLEKGIYTVTIYQKESTGFVSKGTLVPKQASGKPFDYIPFEFIGSDNNDAGVDSAPLLDLANLNIAHFRNSCDFEEMVFMLGQPTPVITGLDKEWVDNVLKGRVVLGSQVALPLPEGCDAFLLQIDESQLALSAMEHKERQAVALGARLVQSAQVQRTAKEAGMEEASEQSLLLSAAKNVNSAYKRALKSAALFAGAPVTDDIGYELNTDFDILRLDSPGRAQLLAEWQRGAVTFSEYRSILRRAGVATLDDEAAQKELQKEAETNAARMALDPSLQNDGKTPTDKNAPKEKAGSPIDRSRKARGQVARNNGKRNGKKQ